MRKIQEMKIEGISRDLKKKTFGLLKFKNTCHFMGHVAKITRIISQYSTLGNEQSRELKSFLEKQPSWNVISQIPMAEEKLGADGVLPRERFGDQSVRFGEKNVF